MSLQVWLPLNGNLQQVGLSNATVSGGVLSSGGKIGQCYAANKNNRLVITHNIAATSEYTLSFWMKIPSAMNNATTWETAISYHAIVSSGGGVGSTNISWASYHNLKIYDDSNHQWLWAAPGSQFTYDKWHLWTLTHTAYSAGVECKIYIDGVLINTYRNAEQPLKIAPTTMYFGNSIVTDSLYFNDIRIYDHCLSLKEVQELAKCLVLHYKLDGLTGGNENLILSSQFVSGGGASSGNTRSYASDGSLKVVAASGNGNWVSLSFPQDSNSNIGSKMAVGDAYTISVDVKVEEGTTLPTLFINGGNGYKRLLGTIVLNQWIRAYYSSTWADPGTSYGNISLHLGFSGLVGTYYFKNFKLEKGSTPTTWSPSPLDAGYSTAYFNTVFDSSGLGYNGTLQSGRNLIISSDTKRYDYSTEFPFYSSKTGNYVTMNNSTLFPSLSTCTLCWWGKYNVAKSLLITGQSTSYFVAAGNPSFYNQNANMSKYYVDGVQVSSVPSYVANQWHHYVLVVNLSSWTTMMLNNYGSADTWSINGKISDFRIYVKELTAEEVLELYHTEASMDREGNYYTRELME